ncbi:IAA-alanine resistance protein 1-like [Salvia splendens]|uniref:IAA-alanine resistance protein 1-like n=1 Tax=Salvia splendens TaxID=180675 RepID=UPI00110293D5|nr:IAA-alanine resistance protein 1-like [Salvia splendens]
MGPVSVSRRQIYYCMLGVLAVAGFGLSAAAAHQCSHEHHHHHHVHDDDHVGLIEKNQGRQTLLPEEIAEEEDLKMMWGNDDDHHDCGHGHHEHDGDVELAGLGLWINAMGCSLLVSLASLICLIMLPFIFIQGKPSKVFVDSLALFGAGAMLGDAFLHQLPHAFGGEHANSHDHHDDHHHEHSGQSHSHSHSLKDLSIGLSILAGIVVFLIVEKVVRYVEEYSGGENDWNTGHHHHHKHSNKLKDDDHVDENHQAQSHDEKSSEGKELDKPAKKARSGKTSEKDSLRKRTTGTNATEDTLAEKVPNGNLDSVEKKTPIKSQSSLVFGYLNLFSDGVHNFTDGMALGSAFLLYGSVGGWSRTLFLLAHELPQEIGDFGILVRSGFTVSKALFFNFLSALAALAGTALALMWGKDPGQSSLMEGFTAGGFIYIALAGVLAEMNNGTTALRNTAIQLVSLVMGMAVALCISLVE